MQNLDASEQRHAALTLHALSDQDRKRVMQKLPLSAIETLQPLLDELLTLGIPKGEPWILDEVRVSGQPQSDMPIARKLWALSAEQAVALLNDQSLDTVALILTCTDWPWRNRALENWPANARAALRTRVEQALKHPIEMKHRLAQALLSRMAESVDRLPAAAQKPSRPPSWMSSLRHLFRP